jgi:hypothetical protein
MCLALHSVSDKNIEKIFKFAPLIWRLIAPDNPEIYRESLSEGKKGLFSKIFAKKRVESNQTLPDLDFVEGENAGADLDKA